MGRLLSRLFSPWLRRLRGRSRSPEQNGLTAVEYEAVTLIAYEGQKAYARAVSRPGTATDKEARDGFRFRTAVADKVALRTKGRLPEGQ